MYAQIPPSPPIPYAWVTDVLALWYPGKLLDVGRPCLQNREIFRLTLLPPLSYHRGTCSSSVALVYQTWVEQEQSHISHASHFQLGGWPCWAQKFGYMQPESDNSVNMCAASVNP